MTRTAANLANSARQSLWMVLAGLLFALATHCVKLGLASAGSLEMVFYRMLGGLLLVAVLARLGRKQLRTSRPLAHLARAAVGVTALSLLFYALADLPASTAFALNYTSPVFFVILTVAVWREPFSAVLGAALLASLLGLLLLLRPGFEPGLLGPGLIALLSGLFAGMAAFSIRWLGILGESATRTVFYFTLFGTIGAGAAVLATGTSLALAPAAAWGALGLVVFSTCGQLAASHALHQGKSSVTAVFAYSGILFTMLIDMLAYGIAFTAADYLGFALIIAGGCAAMMQPNGKRTVP